MEIFSKTRKIRKRATLSRGAVSNFGDKTKMPKNVSHLQRTRKTGVLSAFLISDL